MMPFTESSLPPVEDSRTVMNERINPDDNTERRVKSDEDIQPALTTTTKPDFAVSKDGPQSSSFDVVDHNGNAQAEEKKHARNLSAHFFEATRLTDDAAENPNDTLKADGYHLGTENNNNKGLVFRSPSKKISSSGQPPPPSPAANVGQKHRRGFSGDVSNPVVAHRRINSIGNSAAVERAQGYYSKNYSSSKEHRAVHRREDSAGLDILSAAVDASAEDLDMAVGSGRKGPWEPPADSRYTTRPPHEAGPRSSPSTVSATSSSYEYPRHRSYPPPPTPAYHAPGAPPPNHTYGPYPPPAFYPPGGPPPPYYTYPVPPYSPPPPRGHDPYKRVYVVDHPVVTQSSSVESTGRSSERLETDEKLFDRKKPMQPPNWNGRGSAAPFPGPEETSRPQRTTTESIPPPSGGPGHHRKMSSYSSLGNLMSSALFPDPEQPSSGGHHRSTSSTASFLNGLEDAGDLFLQNLGAPGAPPPQPPQSTTTTATPVPALPNSSAARKSEPSPPPPSSSAGRLAQGGASKRIRRKCTVDGCPNRVVQGGLCISHGAKRKTCKYPGCTKNVKKAGLCSTHGPARKRCEADGCTKVAVQGGKCIAHGAKKKLCLMDGCTKQAILTGMCKKHHDQSLGIVSARGGGKRVADAPVCVVIDKRGDEPKKASGHTRGLSIFQEISPDAVGNLLEADGGGAGGGGGMTETHPLRRDGDRSTGERGGYRNYY